MGKAESFHQPSFLDSDAQARLAQVIETLKSGKMPLEDAVSQAIRGTEDPARRTYLRNELARRAKGSIAHSQGGNSHGQKSFPTRAMIEDAVKHEEELIANIPEEDL